MDLVVTDATTRGTAPGTTKKAQPFRDGRSAGSRWRYRGSLTREQWLLTETRAIARLRLDEGLSTDQIVERNLAHNYFQYPTEREIRSITLACCLRLDNLSEDDALRRKLAHAIAYGTPAQAAQTNLYALMRTYRIIWEFMVGVVGEKFQRLDTHLAKHEMVTFLEGLRSQSETVAGWSDATLNKIRQVLAKCLVEAGYLSSTRSEELRPILLDLDLEQAVRANGDAIALPAFSCVD